MDLAQVGTEIGLAVVTFAVDAVAARSRAGEVRLIVYGTHMLDPLDG